METTQLMNVVNTSTKRSRGNKRIRGQGKKTMTGSSVLSVTPVIENEQDVLNSSEVATASDVSEKSEVKDLLHSQSDYRLVHSVPGRMRVYVEALKTSADFVGIFSESVIGTDGVISVRVNKYTATAAISFDPCITSVERIMAALQEIRLAHDCSGDESADEGFSAEVAHGVSGRMRIRIWRIAYDKEFARGIGPCLMGIEGVQSVRVGQDAGSLVVNFDNERISAEQLVSSVSALTIAEIYEKAAENPVGTELAVAGAGQEKSSRLPLYIATAATILSLFGMPWISFVSYPLIGLISIPVFKRAWNVVTRERRLNVDFLDALSVIAAIATGDVRNAAMIVWLITLADYIRDLTQARSHRAIDELLEYDKQMSWVVRDGNKVQIPAKEIVVGDTVVAYTGSRIPVDGEVTAEVGTVDQQMLTGESLPVVKQSGDKVYAGTLLTEGRLYLTAEKVGSDTKAATIVRLVESAPVHETRAQNYAEKVADGLVTPSLIGAIAVATATRSISRFAGIVTVDFGTGIRVSAPTTVLSSMAACARNGVLIKGGAFLEKLSQVSVIIFDKTGTLTHGVPEISDVVRHNGISEDRALALAAGAAARQTHPVSLAVCRKAESLMLEIPARDSLNFRVGRGLEAEVDGQTIHLGSDRFMTELGVDSSLSKLQLRSISTRANRFFIWL